MRWHWQILLLILSIFISLSMPSSIPWSGQRTRVWEIINNHVRKVVSGWLETHYYSWLNLRTIKVVLNRIPLNLSFMLPSLVPYSVSICLLGPHTSFEGFLSRLGTLCNPWLKDRFVYYVTFTRGWLPHRIHAAPSNIAQSKSPVPPRVKRMDMGTLRGNYISCGGPTRLGAWFTIGTEAISSLASLLITPDNSKQSRCKLTRRYTRSLICIMRVFDLVNHWAIVFKTIGPRSLDLRLQPVHSKPVVDLFIIELNRVVSRTNVLILYRELNKPPETKIYSWFESLIPGQSDIL